MLRELPRPDLKKQLLRLRDFQRDTVEYVFQRMYGELPASRFLVADEVGLGKTFVARGLIAKVVDLLWEKGRSHPHHIHLLELKYCSSEYQSIEYYRCKRCCVAGPNNAVADRCP